MKVYHCSNTVVLKLSIVVIQDNKDGKRSVCKNCARKKVNCYRMFMELRQGEGFQALQKLLLQPVLGVQSLFETSDLTIGVTPKEKWQKAALCENEAEGAQ